MLLSRHDKQVIYVKLMILAVWRSTLQDLSEPGQFTAGAALASR